MTVRLSPHKVSRIMADFFSGVPQNTIARRRGVDQSTVSIYASRLRTLANEIGILQAGKEFGVLKEVDSLRSLSVELAKVKLTVEDALEGVRIAKLFGEIGVPRCRHAELVRLCGEIGDPAFIEASLELIKVERDSGMGYGEVVQQSIALCRELTSKRNELEGVRAKLNSTNRLLAKKKKEVAEEEAKLAGIRRDYESEKRGYEDRLIRMRTESKFREDELAEFADLKARLAKLGVTFSTLIKLAKEFTHEQTKS
jgi:hypothetical protein